MQKPLCLFLISNEQNKCNGISFIDSFCIKVFHNRRIHNHKTFKNLTKRGKTSIDWFYGFRVNLLINTKGELIDICIIPGNCADNNEDVLQILFKNNIFGIIAGDKNYHINEKKRKTFEKKGINIIVKDKKNMKKHNYSIFEKTILKKRGVIEPVGGVLKKQYSMEHSRHRSVFGEFYHLLSSLAAYFFKKSKPSVFCNISWKSRSEDFIAFFLRAS